MPKDFTKSTLNYPVGAPTPIRRVSDKRAPNSFDTRNFIPGDEWLDTTSKDWWKFIENTSAGALWVKIGGTNAAIETFDVDASSGGGTDPVEPNASNEVILTASTVAAGTTPLRSVSTAANTVNYQIQQSQAVAAPNATNSGICHFDNSHFSVDANGFVQLIGGDAAVDSFTTNLGGPVLPDASGAILVNASSTTYTDGATLNTLKTELQGANHALFVGQGTNTPATTIAVGTTGQLLVGSSSANPAFASTAEGDFAFTQTTNPSSTPRRLVVSNADTANTASDASIVMQTGGTSSGDPYNQYAISTTRSWVTGPDVSDSDSFKITTAASSSLSPRTGTEIFKATTAGAITFNNAYTFPTADGTSGQILETDGAGNLTFVTPSSGTNINVQTFTTNGTYTPTTGMQFCIVAVLGAGGGGGGSTATGAGEYSCGGGGGAGEFASGSFSSATIGASQAVTIGTGGAGGVGVTGSNGGSSSLGALISCNGGQGGVTVAANSSDTSGKGGDGGSGGTGGDFRVQGQAGGLGVNFPITMQWGGYGAPAYFGGSGVWTQTGVAASAGVGYGSGGSGAVTGASGSAGTGGDGDDGIIIITEYF